MPSLLAGIAVDVSSSGDVFDLPVVKGRAWNLSVFAVPTAGSKVVGLKIQASINGTNFTDITDDEVFVDDEVASLQYRQFPGLQAKVIYTSGVKSCKVAIT